MIFQANGSAIIILMLVLIAIFWYKNKETIWKPVLFPIWVILTFYVNMPNFLYIADGTKIKSLWYIKIVFECYDNYSWIYIILSNFCMTLMGICLAGREGRKSIYTKNQIKEKFDSFILNATEIKIIGRDLDFLLDDSFIQQRKVIEKLKEKSKLLCEYTDNSKLINLYQNLLVNGVQVRSYPSRVGIANLKGQIKVDDHNEHSGIFVLKSTEKPDLFPENVLSHFKKIETFHLTELENSFLLDSVSRHFDDTFADSLNPVIKCIALDLGGVYFDGNIDTFYDYLESNYSIVMTHGKKDRLNIDDDFVLGKINLKELIIRKAVQQSKTQIDDLKEDDWNKILKQWQTTWNPNFQIKKLVTDLSKEGYKVIPFTNLDKQNGDKYIRDNDIPDCCEQRYFSYERGKCKPDESSFRDFMDFIKINCKINYGYQILLIDDEHDNLNMAKKLNWNTIYYRNDSEQKIWELVKALKEKGILPGSYKLDNEG